MSSDTVSGTPSGRRDHKSSQAFRTISEVADELDLPQHVLRFWETKFHQVSPMKRGGGRRYYRPEDVDLLRRIKGLLHHDGFTIKGVQKLLGGGGVKNLPEADLQPDSADQPATMSTSQSAPHAPSSPPSISAPNADVLGALVLELESIRDSLRDGLKKLA